MTTMPPNAIHPLTRTEWRKWLAVNHQQDKGVWLISFKKATGKPSLSYAEAVEEALCFGWIDSKPNKLDAERAMLWFAPRKSGSGWSKPNKIRVEALLEGGLMTPAGLAKVEAAKQDGSWYALDAVEQNSGSPYPQPFGPAQGPRSGVGKDSAAM
jgi:uncharacterized protein YdeI (YjbR/CyaY-like superfamily)